MLVWLARMILHLIDHNHIQPLLYQVRMQYLALELTNPRYSFQRRQLYLEKPTDLLLFLETLG